MASRRLEASWRVLGLGLRSQVLGLGLGSQVLGLGLEPKVLDSVPSSQSTTEEQSPPHKRVKSTLFSSYERRRNSNSTECPTARQVPVSTVVKSYLDFVRQQSVTSSSDPWKAVLQETSFSVLHNLLEKIFCTPATLAPVERVFSHSGLFMRPHRARMGDKMLADLVFLKCNKHI